MAIKQIWPKAFQLLKKYRYVALMLGVGIMLLLLPAGGTGEAASQSAAAAPIQQEQTLEEQLEQILSQIRGAGKVRVMLSLRTGAETLYQTDGDVSYSDSGSSEQTKAVTVTDGQRNETGLIRQINPPSYLGAVVVCQGGDDPKVQLDIVNAVSRITGLGADKISVLKMK